MIANHVLQANWFTNFESSEVLLTLDSMNAQVTQFSFVV